jgi:hypothetical protein
MKTRTARINWLLISLMGIAVLIAHSGCISAASVGHSGKRLVDLSHKVDVLQSAYLLPDGNIVVFVSGRLSKYKGKADFSLLVPRPALLKIKEVRRAAFASESGYRTMSSYDASIGPSSELRLESWSPLKTDREKQPDVHVYGTAPLEYDDYIPAQNLPVLYAIDRAPGASNEKGLKELWGGVELIYVDTYPDGTVFRCKLVPKAERIEKTRNGLVWLPVTVPLDVATLPAQALWGAIFVAVSAAEAAGNR